MVNVIMRSIVFLVAMANKAIAGMTQYAAQLTLPYAAEQDLPAKLADMNTANAAHQTAATQLKAKRLALENAVHVARIYILLVRDSLKPVLGNKYSQAWNAVGFSARLTVSYKADPLLNTLQLINVYLTDNPIANGGANVAAAQALVLHDSLVAAIAAVNQAKDAVSQAMQNRNQKSKALESALRTLLSELHQVLDPVDSRWLAFGFNKPGLKATPAVPQNVISTLIGASAVSVKWDGAARASYYRVWKKVIGVDDDYVPVGSPADLDFTIEGLPGNSQVEIVVSAVNNGGESQKSTAILVQTL